MMWIWEDAVHNTIQSFWILSPSFLHPWDPEIGGWWSCQQPCCWYTLRLGPRSQSPIPPIFSNPPLPSLYQNKAEPICQIHSIPRWWNTFDIYMIMMWMWGAVCSGFNHHLLLYPAAPLRTCCGKTRQSNRKKTYVCANLPTCRLE